LTVRQGGNTFFAALIARSSPDCDDRINPDLRATPCDAVNSSVESKNCVSSVPGHHLLCLQHDGLLPCYPAQRLPSDVKPQDQGRHKSVTPYHATIPERELLAAILPEIHCFQKHEAIVKRRGIALYHHPYFMPAQDPHMRS
jgi:hypothetical protein